MKERPILFSGEMVRAIIDGRKTQTRRVMNPQPSEGFSPSPAEMYSPAITDEDGYQDAGPEIFGCYDKYGEDEGYECHYGKPGERLWVRETFTLCESTRADGKPSPLYRATSLVHDSCEVKWKPSIFMPRWASRIVLEIAGVRVERVQDISASDARREGIERVEAIGCDVGYRDYQDRGGCFEDPRNSFKSLWDSINKKRGFGWEKNPWVWVIEFKRA